MLQDYFEDFALMEKVCKADGLGGESVSLEYVMSFRGGLTHTAGQKISAGGRMTLRSELVLLHEFDVTLSPGEIVRRERDGSLWRVCSSSDDMRTPAFSGLQFAQANVERLVIPC